MNKMTNKLADLYIIKYNASDLRPVHSAIAAVVMQDDKVLMLDHVKLSFWTIPIGKIEEGDSMIQTLKAELKEEVNVVPINYKRIGQFSKKYIRGNTGIQVSITSHIFRIDKWRGPVKNAEPHKHRSFKWMTVEEIKKLEKAKKLSDSTINAMKFMKWN